MNYTALQCGLNLLSDGSRVTSDEGRSILKNVIQLFAVRYNTISLIDFIRISIY